MKAVQKFTMLDDLKSFEKKASASISQKHNDYKKVITEYGMISLIGRHKATQMTTGEETSENRFIDFADGALKGEAPFDRNKTIQWKISKQEGMTF